MKTAFFALLELLCMWSTPAMARILESSVDTSENEQIGSQDYGYVTAEDLWKNGNGNYSCDK